MKNINRVGVVGAGTMGAALAQKFAQEGLPVVLVDREIRFVERGLKGIAATLDEGVKRRLFTPGQCAEVLARIEGTDEPNRLQSCDLVIEAIFENFEAKTALFRELGDVLPAPAILATNTSSFSVSELAEAFRHPENFIGMHYFYHAAKNRLVEIIPGKKTAPETVEAARRFAARTGKDPIFCKDRYGFAVNRFFVPWLNEAVRLFEEGMGGTAAIDQVCRDVFKVGMGPFALMNATGVNIAYHAQKTLEAFGPFYKVAALLQQQGGDNRPWDIPEEAAPVSQDGRRETAGRMLGTVFLVCSQILDEEVCSAAELNRGARIGLRWHKGPVEMMQAVGETEVRRLVRLVADHYGVAMPASIGQQFWRMQFISLQTSGRQAVVTINRPEDLNALNETVVEQLDEQFSRAEREQSVQTVFITGAGKAFMAGADIKFFVDNIRDKNLERIVEFTRRGQELFERIDQSPRKVVALINGLALGGGLELALCADVILAVPNALMAFPETGIGIYPGLGGTWRSVRRIGKPLSKYLIFTGKRLTPAEALEIGLIDAIVSSDQALRLLAGEAPLPAFAGQNSLNLRWQTLSRFFERNSLDQIMSGEIEDSELPPEEQQRLCAGIAAKAPLALKIAERLINEQSGSAGELRHLREIFASEDALLGLSSVGQKVTFGGR